MEGSLTSSQIDFLRTAIIYQKNGSQNFKKCDYIFRTGYFIF